jgi:plasmid stabilization system protein ParE
MRIRFTLSAQAQLKSAVDYIRRDRPTATVSYFNKVKKRLKRLETFPNSGRKVPEFPERQIREVIIPPYRFFYQQRGKTIWILAVWHEAQLPDDP